MPQEHPVLGVAGLQIMAITENRRFVADHHNLFAGVLGDLLACEIIHALRNVLIGFAPTRLVQVGDQFPIAVLPQRAFAMADTLAAELVAGLNHSLIGGEHERGFASGLAHGIQRVKNRVGGLGNLRWKGRKSSMDNRPIGVFDSGLGGLTGVRELRRRLPHENIVYFGDTGRVPYGSRSPETILQYARQDIAFLLSKDVKCIMAACGTVSSTYPAAEAEKLPVPYLGVVDAAAREAAFSTRNRRIGVIGTAATIRSRSYEALLRRLVPGVEITARPCPLFVPLVEAGYVDHSAPDKQEITKLVIAQYLTEIRDAGVDTLILGCTHYPLIKTMIGEFMGRNVVLVDPAKTAAHHLERILSERGLKADHPAGQAHFYVSDAPDGFVQTADLFLGEYKGGEVEQIAIDKY